MLSIGGVPLSDDQVAAAVSGDTSANLLALSELLRMGVARRNQSGAIFNKRMVLDEQERQRWRKNKAGQRGDVHTNVHTDVSSVSRPSSSSLSSSHSKKELKAKPAARTAAFVVPDWVPPCAWSTFLECRKANRIKNHPAALWLLLKTLEKLRLQGHHPKDVLDQSIERGYRGLFPVNSSAFASKRDAVRAESSVGAGPTLGNPQSCAICGKTGSWHANEVKHHRPPDHEFAEEAVSA